MQVLLTGALGNIGFSTLQALLAEGHDVVAFDLESRRAQKLASEFDGRVRFVWGDITRPESLSHALEGVDAVIHLAAIIPPFNEKVPELARRVNLDATRTLIEQMEASPTAKRLVFASSQGSSATSRIASRRCVSTRPSLPTDDYGRQKVACEEAIRKSGLRWSILRLSAVTPIHLPIAGPQHHVRLQPRRAIRVPPSRPTPERHSPAPWPAASRSGRPCTWPAALTCRMTFYDFVSALMNAINIGPLPTDAFVRKTRLASSATGRTRRKVSGCSNTSNEDSASNWKI